MKNDELKRRTKCFALKIIGLFVILPKTLESQIIGKQVLRSGTSVGAHYHEAYRAKSNADFISKIEGGLQELEETSYWLDLLKDSKIVSENKLADLINENEQLIAIFASIVIRVKAKTK
ncbi:MAG: four helix bundle protein [Acidobacteria bacterium]|nr:four helix bundle protein [Acidobacteriota bacterium]